MTQVAERTRPRWRSRLAAIAAGALAIGVLSAAPATAAVGSDGTFTFTTSGGNATITGLAADVPGTLTVPASVTDDAGTYPVTAIGSNAFYNKGYTFTGVVLPDGLTTIGDTAFAATNLGDVRIPASVTSVEEYAFTNAGLTSVELLGSGLTLGTASFSNNPRLASVSLPEGITAIPTQAFDNRSTKGALTSVSIPDSVQTIGSSAFGNNRLTHVDLPQNPSFTSLHGFSDNELSSLDIPDSVTSIAELDGNKFTAFTVPDSVTSLGVLAFANNQITDIDWGHSSSLSIGNSAFVNNRLRNLNLGSNVVSVGPAAFTGNPLETVTINGTGVSLRQRAFVRDSAPTEGPGFSTVTFRAGPPSAVTGGAGNQASFKTGSAAVISTPTVIYPASQENGGQSLQFTPGTWQGYTSESYVESNVPDAPATPTSTVVDNKDITVSWRVPADGGSSITGYTVTLTRTGGEPVTKTVSASSLTTTFEDLAPGSYTATVKATNAIGDSPESTASAPATIATVPDAPAQPDATVSGKAVTVTWTAPAAGGSPLTGYTVELTPAEGEAVTKTVAAGVTSATFEALAPGTYTATVTATNAVGDSPASAASTPVDVLAAVPSAPDKPTVALDGNNVTVTWAPPSDDGGSAISGYTVTLTPGSGQPIVTSVGAAPTSAEFRAVPGGTWTATVAATNAVGESSESAASDEVEVPGVPAAPAKPTVSVDGKDITVTWAAPADGGSPITGYEVTLTPSSGAPLTQTAGSSETSVTFAAVPAGTWTATVAASNDFGDSSASPASEAVTIATDLVSTRTSASVGRVVYGSAGRVVVGVSGGASGSVSVRVGSRTIVAPLSGGKAALVLPARSLRPGGYTLVVSYGGVAGRFGASSTTVRVTVAKAAAAVRVKAPARVKRGKAAKFTVTVAASGVRATGRVTVKVAGKSRTVRLNAKGRATVRVKVGKKTKPGRKAVTVSYRGDSYVAPAQAKKTTTKVVR